MKRSIKSLEGYTLKETDGEIGKVDEFYFDDVSWTIRYLVIKTGNWFSGKKVLISPKALLAPDWENKTFPVNLTKSQIENSPDIDTEKPVSRQHEEELFTYYTWDPYWGDGAHGAGIFGAMPGDLYESEVEAGPIVPVENSQPQDPHLRSSDEVKGYTIHATDGEIGKVTDYIVDDSDWRINYLVIDTGDWLNSKKILLPAGWIKQVKWDNSIVIVNVTVEQVQNCPVFDPDQPLNAVDENILFDYYGRPHSGI
ncbi:MAG: PRC-barrel domain-containing protein [Ginsengibacter sp.]